MGDVLLDIDFLNSGDATSALNSRFDSRISVNNDLNRKLVSFQGNRRQPFQNWFRYREGFSAALVEQIICELSDEPGVLLDPFAGVGTALFAAQPLGWNSIGIELMPVGFAVMQARIAARRIKAPTFLKYVELAERRSWASHFDSDFAFKHIPITEGAFSKTTEREWAGFQAFCRNEVRNPYIRRLFHLAALSVLEDVSYTRKDGQYLRWDSRAPRGNLRSEFQKGEIKPFAHAIKHKLREIYSDLSSAVLQPNSDCAEDEATDCPGILDVRLGSCLDMLPEMEAESVDIVVTSPPYCNRYDYTRTYALELAALGYGAERVKALRQRLLSCTVENRTKEDQLREKYRQFGRETDYVSVSRAFARESALFQILSTLEQGGRLNNANVPRMIRNYFFEMAFVLFELARIIRPGGRLVMVNDNVRYAGVEVPVDLLLSSLAESFGFETAHIWALPRGKGNSSQQMGEHGRTELRKSVLVWAKE